MKFNQLRILTYLTEAFKKDLVFNSKELKDLLTPIWEYVPDDINFTLDSFDAIDISTNQFIYGKQQAKMFRTLRNMFPNKEKVTDDTIKQIIDVLIKNKSSKTSIDDPMFKGFEFWGSSIYELYKLGCTPSSLTKSCMTEPETLNFTKFYDWINSKKNNHTVKVRGLIYKQDGQIDGRALVWSGVEGTGDKLFMDRVYPEPMTTLFQQYAEAQGWAYRKGRGYLEFDNKSLVGAKDISITIDIKKLGAAQLVPYMDTFASGDHKTGRMENSWDLPVKFNKTNGIPFSTPVPTWFLDNLENIDIPTYTVNRAGKLIWEDGIWEDGTWEGGLWLDGTWEKGFWERGTFKYGTWKGGTWESGTFDSGTWKNGTWKTGKMIGFSNWENGTFENGLFYDSTWENGLWVNGTFKDSEWKDGKWRGGIWKNSTWITGWIYDPEKKGNYNEDWEWNGDYVKSTLNPNDYKKLKKGK